MENLHLNDLYHKLNKQADPPPPPAADILLISPVDIKCSNNKQHDNIIFNINTSWVYNILTFIYSTFLR